MKNIIYNYLFVLLSIASIHANASETVFDEQQSTDVNLNQYRLYISDVITTIVQPTYNCDGYRVLTRITLSNGLEMEISPDHIYSHIEAVCSLSNKLESIFSDAGRCPVGSEIEVYWDDEFNPIDDILKDELPEIEFNIGLLNNEHNKQIIMTLPQVSNIEIIETVHTRPNKNTDLVFSTYVLEVQLSDGSTWHKDLHYESEPNLELGSHILISPELSEDDEEPTRTVNFCDLDRDYEEDDDYLYFYGLYYQVGAAE